MRQIEFALLRHGALVGFEYHIKDIEKNYTIRIYHAATEEPNDQHDISKESSFYIIHDDKKQLVLQHEKKKYYEGDWFRVLPHYKGDILFEEPIELQLDEVEGNWCLYQDGYFGTRQRCYISLFDIFQDNYAEFVCHSWKR
jgi:hypothetical protein